MSFATSNSEISFEASWPKKPHRPRPAAARGLETQKPEDDGAAHAFDANRHTDLIRHLDHGRKKQARPRLELPRVQDRTGLHLYFLHPWDSGQEITGVQGIVAGGVHSDS